jgi:hypothetical protein
MRERRRTRDRASVPVLHRSRMTTRIDKVVVSYDELAVKETA